MLAYFVQQASYQTLEHLTYCLEEGGSRTACHILVAIDDKYFQICSQHSALHNLHFHTDAQLYYVLEASTVGLITKVSIFQVNSTLLIYHLLILITLQVSVFIVAMQSKQFALIVVNSVD